MGASLWRQHRSPQYHQGRLQDPVPVQASASLHSNVHQSSGGPTQGRPDSGRSSQFTPETGYRESQQHPFSRILQSYLPGTKEEREVEVHYRPQPTQPVGPDSPLQDGNGGIFTECGSTKRFRRLHRSSGRILAYSSTQVFSQVPEVRPGRNRLSVLLSSIRPQQQSTDIHHGTRRCDDTSKAVYRDLLFCLPRRHHVKRQKQGTTVRSVELFPTTNSQIGPSNQPREVPDSAVSGFLPCGNAFPHAPQFGQATGRSSRQIDQVCAGPIKIVQPDGQGLSHPTRYPQCGSRLTGVGTFTHETHSIPSAGPLEAEGFSSGSSRPSDERYSRNLRPLVRPGVVNQWCAVKPASSTACTDDRRQFVRLGGCPITAKGRGKRSLGQVKSGPAYKRARVECSVSGPEEVSTGGTQQAYYAADRQHHGSGVHQEAGWHEISTHDHGHLGSPVVVPEEPSSSIGISHLRCPQRPSRRSVEVQTSGNHGVVLTSVGIQTDKSPVWRSSCRSVRHRPQSQASCVRFAMSRPQCVGRGRFINTVDGDGSLRLSPVSSASQGSTENQGRPGTGSASSPLVATEVMDRPPVGLGPGLSKGSSTMASATETTKKRPLPRSGGVSSSARLAIVRKAIRRLKFSKAVSDRIANPRRQSSTALYNVKWKGFVKWAKDNGHAPTEATIPIVADFLLYLYEVKKLSPSTIKGYRAALADTFTLLGKLDIGKDPNISKLIRSFDRDRPRFRSLSPKWNLSWVLHCLASSPFEPMYLANIKLVSYKTAFLLAFASAKRVSELHALSVSPACCRVSKISATLIPEPGFMAKNETPQFHPEPIQLGRLTDFSDDAQSRNLCPLRALRIYLSRTKDIRKGRLRLFLPLVQGKESITKATIARWITQAIILAYRCLSDRQDLRKILKVNAHELRAVSASWSFLQNCSLKDIMSAAFWRSETVFSSFYLRSLQSQADDLYQLGPVTTAQMSSK